MKLLIIVLCFISLSSMASEKQTLNEYIAEQIEQFENIETTNEQSSNWYLSKIRVRVKAKGAVEVPFLGKLEVKPYVELHFE